MKEKQFFAYSASAGSGKTYALALRYIALLFLNQSPSEILAATFTKKAANEMRQRVLRLLKNIKNEPEFVNNLCSQYGLDKEEVLSQKDAVLKRFLTEPNHIMTIDSFFNSILRSCALQIGLEPDFKIKNASEEEFAEYFIKNVEHSGKMNSFVSLALNLNKRKSSDLTDLLEALFNLDALLPKVSYSASNLQALEEQIEKEREIMHQMVIESGASPTAVKNFAPGDFKKFISKTVFEKSSLQEHRNYKKYLKNVPQMEGQFLKLKELIAQYHQNLESTILHYLFEIYNSYKNSRIELAKARGELNFNDILYFTHRLLSNEITKDFLYFKLDTKFKHILLDEFQDTSALQFLILEPLIDEIFAGQGQSDFRTFFYVGDVKQSLYRFRGGVEELFGYVAQKYGIELANLDTNYRSSYLIVQKTNEWFKDKIEGFTEQKAISQTEGYVEVATSENLIEEAINRVEFLQKSGVKLENIAALVFKNKDAIALQEELKLKGFEAVLQTASSLKNNQKIAALVSVLKYLTSSAPLFLEPFKQKLNLGQNPDFSWFKPYMGALEVLERLVREYSYFAGDLNVLKLLDFAKNFSTIEEFLQEFELSDIDLAQNSAKGVQIMTVHGSKGLEFDYVIALDNFGRPQNRGNMLIFKDKSPVEIEKIFYRFSTRENFDKEYAAAVEQEKIYSAKDRLNRLYVALTRPKLGLIVLQKPKYSEYEVLGLEDIKIGKVVPSKEEPAKELEPLSPKISSYGRQEIASAQDEEPAPLDYDALTFGEALHYCLEMLNFNNPESLDLAIEAVHNRYGAKLAEKELENIRQRAQNLLIDSKFKELIEGKELLKEQPIVYKENFYQIDLLAKGKENMIFDYKSSKHQMPKHKTQIQNYINALKTIENKPTYGYILYVLKDGVESVKVIDNG